MTYTALPLAFKQVSNDAQDHYYQFGKCRALHKLTENNLIYFPTNLKKDFLC